MCEKGQNTPQSDRNAASCSSHGVSGHEATESTQAGPRGATRPTLSWATGDTGRGVEANPCQEQAPLPLPRKAVSVYSTDGRLGPGAAGGGAQAVGLGLTTLRVMVASGHTHGTLSAPPPEVLWVRSRLLPVREEQGCRLESGECGH